MTPNLSKYVNKTILVSIPVLSEDTKCKPYTLIGIELIGLWLQSPDLAGGFLDHRYKSQQATTWAFFIPFSQIACVVVPSAGAAPSGPGATVAGQSQAGVQPAAPPVSAPSPDSGSSSQAAPKTASTTRKKQKE
jgi:hypothetical protein